MSGKGVSGKALLQDSVFSKPRAKNTRCYGAQEPENTEMLCNSQNRKINTACYRSIAKEVQKMPYNRKAFGVVISKLRVQKGLTQENLSGLAGIARSHLAALENGEKTVKLDTMWRIADALEIKPSELIRRIENEQPETRRS